MALSLDELILKLEKEDQDLEQKQFEKLTEKTIALRDKYLQIKAEYDKAAVELYNLAKENNTKILNVNGRSVRFLDEYREVIDPLLAYELKSKLSPEQWGKCFKNQDPKIIMSGIRRYKNMGGSVAKIIEEYTSKEKRNIVPSMVDISKPKEIV